MLRILRNRKAQTTAEYAILIGLIIAALVAMQTYVKRGLQARMRDATDRVASENTAIGATTQYEPYYLESTMDQTRDVSEREDTVTGGSVTRAIQGEDVSKRTGTQTIHAAQ